MCRPVLVSVWELKSFGQEHVFLAMEEHRASPPQRVLKSGKIIYNNSSIVIDCTVRNISDTGAQLKVPTSVAIPDRFEFSETMGGKRRPVTVMWRKGDLIGIRFA